MQQTPIPAPIPDRPAAAPQPGALAPGIAASAAPSATVVYRAARAYRDELQDQMETLTSERHTLLAELDDHNDVAGPAATGMQQRIAQIDVRIAELDKSVATANASVASAAAAPGAVTTTEMPRADDVPKEAFIVAPFALMALLLPISFAFARRIFRRNAATVSELPRELMERLGRLEQTGEATAIEVERIGEGQRFVTRLMTERSTTALADPLGARSQDRV